MATIPTDNLIKALTVRNSITQAKLIRTKAKCNELHQMYSEAARFADDVEADRDYLNEKLEWAEDRVRHKDEIIYHLKDIILNSKPPAKTTLWARLVYLVKG